MKNISTGTCASIAACALTLPAMAQAPGSVIAWGSCDTSCASPEFGGPYTSICARHAHVAAIGASRSVVCWGSNYAGQCNVPPDLGPVISVSVGQAITVAVREDGSVRCWGYSTVGGCPTVPLPGSVGAVQVACSLYSAAIRLADGTVLGGTPPTAASPSSFIAAGDEHWLSIRTDGQVVGWGSNQLGQTNTPANLGACKHVAGGGSHSCAVTANGAVRCWGYSNYGQCSVPANLPPALETAAGREHTIVLLEDGTIRGWGHNSWGEANNPGVANARHVACGWYASFALVGTPCIGDLYRNGRIDGADLGILLSEWGLVNPTTQSDLNYDGRVDGADLGSLLSNWGPCPN